MVRSRSNRVVAGVCAGVAYRLGLDPTLVRVVTVVLTVFGGAGLLLYAVGWLLLPDERSGLSIVNEATTPGSHDRTTAVLLGAGLALIALVVLVGLLSDSWAGIVMLALVLIGAAALTRRRSGPQPQPPPVSAPWNPPAEQQPRASGYPTAGPHPPGAEGAGPQTPSSAEPSDPAADPEADHVPTEAELEAELGRPYLPPPPSAWDALGGEPGDPEYPAEVATLKPPPGPKSRLGRLTFFTAVVAVGALGVADVSGVAVPLAAYPVTVLAIAGLGLVVGAWWGRARGLIALGIVSALLVVPFVTWDWIASTEPFGDSDEFTDVTYTPTTLSEVDGHVLEHGAGQVVYDLTDVDFLGTSADLSLQLGAGELTVLVPEGVTVNLDGTVGVGELDAFGQSSAGLGVNVTRTDPGVADGGTLELEIDLGIGVVEVAR